MNNDPPQVPTAKIGAGLEYSSPEFISLMEEVRSLRREISELNNFLQNSPGVRTAYVEDNTALVLLATGPKIYVDSRDQDIGSHLMQSGKWEPHYTRQVQRLVKQDQVCIDVGAHFGYYSVLMAKIVGPNGKVLSFEPNPRLYDLLCKSLHINGFIKKGIAVAHRCALADRNGTAQLSFEVRHSGGGNIFATEAARRARGLEVAEVELKRLDDFAVDTSKPLFMKIDVEGAEYLILKGAEELLRKTADVIVMMEFTPLFINKLLTTSEFLRYLRGLNFRFFMVDLAKDEMLVEKTEREIEDAGPCYLFMARRDISQSR